MSKSMLEQAMLDAEKLKEAATSIAEKKLKEKYQKELKETIDMILEQDEDQDPMFGDTPELTDDPLTLDSTSEQSASDSLKDQIPQAGSQPLNEMDEDEEIEIDFDELQSQFNSKDIQADPVNIQFPLSEEIEQTLQEMMDEENDESGEELDEELTLDYEIVPPGHAGPPTQDEYREADEVQMAKRMSGLNQQLHESKKALKNEKNLTKKQKNEIKNLRDKNIELRNKFDKLKEYVERANVTNAKLLYTNKILRSDSLNERQKKIIIQKLNEAKNVEQAKLLYETLQSAMREQSNVTRNSLSETMGSRTTLQIKPQKENVMNEGYDRRWRHLAGIE